jgi:O-antigen/teichoic acid export membrane protein
LTGTIFGAEIFMEPDESTPAGKFRFDSRIRGVFSLGTGTLAGQLVLIGAVPLLSRIYPPEVFGIFSALIAVVSIAGSIATLKFDTGLILPKSDQDAASMARVALASAAIMSALSATGTWLIGLSEWGGSWTGVVFAPLWVGTIVFLSALISIFTQIALRERAYLALSLRVPLQSITTAIFQLLFGAFTQGPMGLLGGTAVGNVLGLATTMRMSSRILRMRGGRWKRVVRKYWRLPGVLAPSALLNVSSSQLPLLAVVAFYGTGVAGEFGMVQRILAVPATLIAVSVAQVFAAELATHIREGGAEATRIYMRVSGLLALISIPTTLICALLGSLLLPTVLGPGWTLVGDMSVPIAIIMGLSIVVNPTSQVYSIFQSALTLLLDSTRLVLVLAAILINLAFPVGPVPFVWLVSSLLAVHYVATWIYGIHVTRGRFRGI